MAHVHGPIRGPPLALNISVLLAGMAKNVAQAPPLDLSLSVGHDLRGGGGARVNADEYRVFRTLGGPAALGGSAADNYQRAADAQ